MRAMDLLDTGLPGPGAPAGTGALVKLGDEWMTHTKDARLRGETTSCGGTLVFTDVHRPNLKEASCDGCPYVTGVRPDDIRQRRETDEEKWWQT